MNTDDLLKAFISAGLDTPEKVSAMLSVASKQIALRNLDLQIEGLNAKQNEVLKPLQDERTQLLNQRAEVAATLVSP